MGDGQPLHEVVDAIEIGMLVIQVLLLVSMTLLLTPLLKRRTFRS